MGGCIDRDYSRFGDVWAWARVHEDSELYRYGVRICPWWAKKRVESVRFRADNNDYWGGGVVTVFYRRPRQLLGPWPTRSKRIPAGQHYTETLNKLLRHRP